VLFETDFSIAEKFLLMMFFASLIISASVLPRVSTAPSPLKIFVEHQHPLLISIPQPVVHTPLTKPTPAFTASDLTHFRLYRKRKQREQNAQCQKNGCDNLHAHARDHGAGHSDNPAHVQCYMHSQQRYQRKGKPQMERTPFVPLKTKKKQIDISAVCCKAILARYEHKLHQEACPGKQRPGQQHQGINNEIGLSSSWHGQPPK
jgi:hypothetical protein